MEARLKRLIGVSMLCACGGMLPLDGSDSGANDGSESDVTSTADAGADVVKTSDASAADSDTGTPCSSGEVMCGGICYPNDVDHCGVACAVCTTPSFGTATCDGTSCGVTCDFLQCGTTCVDPSTDTKNCGTCSHDCGSETCNAGVCTPDKLFSVAPYGLTVDSTNLYWATGSEVDQGPKTGGSWSAIAKNLNMVVSIVVVDATNVYWSMDYGVGYVPIGGGTVTTLTSTTAQWPCIPTLGPQAIYIGDYANSSSVFAVPYDGGAAVALEATNLTIYGTGYSAPYVYFSGNNSAPGTLWRTSATTVDAGSELVFSHDAGFTNFPPFIMDDAGSAYAPMTDGVWVVPPDGGAAANASTLSTIRFVAVDSTYLYMASYGAIYREPLGGTSPTTLYTAPTQDIHGMTIDDTYVYFSYAGTNNPGIYRLAK